MRAPSGLMAFGFVAALALPALAPGAPAAAQSAGCNPAYIPTATYCVPDSSSDLNCDDIGNRQIQLRDPNDDPYALDDSGVGDGITCNGDGADGSSGGSSPTGASPPAPASSTNNSAPSSGSSPSTSAAPAAVMAPASRAPLAVGPAVVAIAAPAGTGESLDAALEARFAALEAGFAVFSGESANGGNASASGQGGGAGMVVSSSPQAAPVMAPGAGTSAPAVTTPAANGDRHGRHHHHKRHNRKHNNHRHKRQHHK